MRPIPDNDLGLELSPAEMRAGDEATGVRRIAIISATAFLLSIIPVIGKAINGVMLQALTLYALPALLIYWVIRHKFVNRVGRTPRDLWLSIAIWIGIIAVKVLLL